MKKIFVTVAEFLENGGELIEGRELFDSYNELLGQFDGFNDMNMPLIYKTSFSIWQVYVQIDCTPHYV